LVVAVAPTSDAHADTHDRARREVLMNHETTTSRSTITAKDRSALVEDW
jgi:hypothetical protein